MKKLFVFAGAVALAAAVSAPFAWAVSPAKGVFGGIINGSTHANFCGPHNEGEGYFRVKTTRTGKEIVPPGKFSLCGEPAMSPYITAPNGGPVYPDNGGYRHCDPYNANIATKRIAIHAGAFDFRGYTVKVGAVRYHIRFKGSWVTPRKVKGYTRITRGGCDTGRMRWTMQLVKAS